MPGQTRFAPGVACLATIVLLACADPPAPAKPEVPPASAPTERDPQPQWRFGPTLATATPEGITLTPIAEMASPDRARLHIVAAVHRPGGSPALRIELWTFSQHNDKGVLQLEGEPSVALRTDAGQPAPPARDELRLQLAAPRVQVLRPVGLPVADPRALLDRLTVVAKIVRDPAAQPRAQVDALAEVFRGLDDPVSIASRRLAPMIDSLAAGLEVVTLKSISARRAEITTGGKTARTLQCARKSGGWAISGDRPAPASAH